MTLVGHKNSDSELKSRNLSLLGGTGFIARIDINLKRRSLVLVLLSNYILNEFYGHERKERL